MDEEQERLVEVIDSIQADINLNLEHENLSQYDEHVFGLIFRLSNLIKTLILQDLHHDENNQPLNVKTFVFQFSFDYYSSYLFKLFTKEDIPDHMFDYLRKYKEHFFEITKSK